jgi:hypothetical protein
MMDSGWLGLYLSTYATRGAFARIECEQEDRLRDPRFLHVCHSLS